MQEQSFPVDFEEIKNFIVGRHVISHVMKTIILKIVEKNVVFFLKWLLFLILNKVVLNYEFKKLKELFIKSTTLNKVKNIFCLSSN